MSDATKEYARERGLAIMQANALDQITAIPYRPYFRRITGSATASILLQQIIYWWQISGRKPFYKFRAPCRAAAYRPGDSWTEELEFGEAEFDGALHAIGTKITKGTSKSEALACDDAAHLVIYWTDANRMTWYMLNENALAPLIAQAVESRLLGNLESRNRVRISENRNYPSSESTSETNTHIEVSSIDTPSPTRSVSVSADADTCGAAGAARERADAQAGEPSSSLKKDSPDTTDTASLSDDQPQQDKQKRSSAPATPTAGKAITNYGQPALPEVGAAPAPKKRARRRASDRPVTMTPPVHDVFEAICEVCQIDPKLLTSSQLHQVIAAAKALAEKGAHKYTGDEVRVSFGKDSPWYRAFPGIQPDGSLRPPVVTEVRQHIVKCFSQAARSKPQHKMPTKFTFNGEEVTD